MNNKLTPRAEHPRPQFYRDNWLNLNGEWDFEFDFGNSGTARGMMQTDAVFTKKIIVPFCPESKLSGIEYTDYINAVWYRKHITITEEQKNSTVLLHFGAVDYKSTIFINGKKCGEHKGGYSSFSIDITSLLETGDNVITVNAVDDIRSGKQPAGKQSVRYASRGCSYTRTTGIWQTVWLEFVPKTYIESVKIYADAVSGNINVSAYIKGKPNGCIFADITYNGEKVASVQSASHTGEINLFAHIDNAKLWNVGEPNLYDIEFKLDCDVVKSYFGFRTIEIDGNKVLINKKSVFQRLVLDQGFYPDGIYTAPEDKDLKNDIIRSMELGFNGARLHEKVFEERFLYYADKLGYIVWGEFPNWGMSLGYSDNRNGVITANDGLSDFITEWTEVVERDYNHPSIVGWCPNNETWNDSQKEVVGIIYDITKSLDKTRPVIDTSGGYHIRTDIYDTHDYTQDIDIFRQRYLEEMTDSSVYDRFSPLHQQYIGGPFMLSEFGGSSWARKSVKDINDKNSSWGYGNAAQTPEEFAKRFEELISTLLKQRLIFGYCYTQLYDVEQEQNGLYYYSREYKFSSEIKDFMHKIQSQKAAIED